MAVYEITSPDGGRFQVTAPDDATPDAVQKYAMAMQTRAPDVSSGQAALISGGGYLDRLAAGLKQKTRAVLGDNVVGAIDKVGSALGMADSSNLEQRQDQNAPAMAALQEQHPVASFAGQLPLALAAKTPLGMAGMGALEYGTPEQSAERAAAGYLGGKAGEYLGAGVGRVLQPVRAAGNEFVGATKALFDKYNINPLPSQLTGSLPVALTESTLSKLPGGGRVRAVVDAQQQGLNTATMGAMGAEGSSVTPEAVQAAKSALGSKFNSIPGQTTVVVDRPLADALTGVEKDYYKNLSPDQRSIVKTYIDDILSHSEDGMPGDVYQKARSRISARANSTQDSELSNALTGVYKALDRAFDRSAGDETAAVMQTTRDQYRVAKTVDKLSNVSGNVSPARLATAAKNLPGAGGDLAQLGARMKGLPDSNTAQRLFYQSLLSGGIGTGAGFATGDPLEGLKWGAGALAGQVAGPWLASQAITRAPIKNYLTSGLLNVSPEIEKFLRLGGAAPGALLGQRFVP